MECRCDQAMEFAGDEAETYAAGHLVRDVTRDGALADHYSCPDTGKRWILDFPEAASNDPGQARLRAEAPT